MRILIAIDEQSCARAALNFVQEHTRADDLIKLIHVVSPVMIDSPTSAHPLFLESVAYETSKAAKDLLEQTAGKLKEFIKTNIDFEVLVGIPGRVVVEEARQWNADLIIVGAHCRRGLDRFFFGSVSFDIAAQAPCTVLTVPMTPVHDQQHHSQLSEFSDSVNTGILL